MSRFIPIDKIKQLRESAKMGDLRAQKILDMQLAGTEDFGSLMNDYFAPKAEEGNTVIEEKPATASKEETPYEIYLRENELEDSEDMRKEFSEATGQDAISNSPLIKEECENCIDFTKLIEDEQEAITGYVEFLNNLLASNIDESKKALINQRITKIIEDEKQHIDILNSLKNI